MSFIGFSYCAIALHYEQCGATVTEGHPLEGARPFVAEALSDDPPWNASCRARSGLHDGSHAGANGRAGAAERVEHDSAAPRAVLDGISDQLRSPSVLSASCNSDPGANIGRMPVRYSPEFQENVQR